VAAAGTRRSKSEERYSDPLWFKDAVIYELHVRSFNDSTSDGIGDFAGLTQKLDYLQELGVTALWLLPFYESPLRDDGYDIADYRKIHPSYGTLSDFKKFLSEAHRRGLRVITELVVNHTSDQHAWFQRARRAPKGSPHRDYYVWSDTATEYSDARIIFKDFERSNWTWDPVAGQYFWHRFYSHQPDLNFDNPRVRQEILDLIDFWFEMGVDGFRLDAIPYLFEREGTSCENLPETHKFLKEIRAHVDKHFPGRMLLAEANQWPEDAARYFGDGDECHMAYHFPLMPRLFMAVRMEDRFPITEILEQTPEIPENAQWALFLRNHDELTLEMVTDEERDYMYRVYAADDRARINLGIRRRLAPLLGHNRRLIELLNALLLSMRGTPVIYYGDEIGMGDNIYLGDRDAVRTPMQWSADRNAGFSRANPQRLFLPVIIDPEYHYESVNVDAQQANPSLLLWWMRRLISLRNRYRAFSRGTMSFVECDNRHVLAFVREHEHERVLVVANLSRFTQAANLNMPGHAGSVPVEMFGHTAFPTITAEPYFLSLGPHAFYWFVLEPATVQAQAPAGDEPPILRVTDHWDELLNGRRRALEGALAVYLPSRRWFGSKTRHVSRLRVDEVIPFRMRSSQPAAWLLIRVEYDSGEPDIYGLMLTAIPEQRVASIERTVPWALIAPVQLADDSMMHLVDALAVPEVAIGLLEAFRTKAKLLGASGTITFATEPGIRVRHPDDELHPSISRSEQSNTSLLFGSEFVLKMLRRVESGIHPQVEIGRFLARSAVVEYVPRLAGTVAYGKNGGKHSILGIMEFAVPHQTDAWTFAVETLGLILEEVAAGQDEPPALPLDPHPMNMPAPHARLMNVSEAWLDFAKLLGRRTAELHLALANAGDSPDFAPEKYTPFYRRALAQGFRAQSRIALRALRAAKGLTEGAQELAEEVLAREPEILEQLHGIASRPLQSQRIRCHGDLHLGQVLVWGRDPVFIDFEGEPARSLGDRRIRRSPLRDVAGMVRSFHYASQFAWRELAESQAAGLGTDLEAWARAWYLWTASAYIAAYTETATEGGLLTGDADEHRFLLDAFMLDKAFYELSYELDNRPSWVEIPLKGILETLSSTGD
jgi:maltose alpha-D-glucosyltransferase / alpha-amylase